MKSRTARLRDNRDLVLAWVVDLFSETAYETAQALVEVISLFGSSETFFFSPFGLFVGSRAIRPKRLFWGPK